MWKYGRQWLTGAGAMQFIYTNNLMRMRGKREKEFMGRRLIDADEGAHEIGTASNWNESRYVDFWDRERRIGGWYRIGNRPNEGYAEMSSCTYLPDGSVAFMFGRPTITKNELHAAGQSWEIVSPWKHTRVTYEGEVMILQSPWALLNPKQAFSTAPRTRAKIELDVMAFGLDSVMGQETDQVHLIFVPGQCDYHYQHLVRTTGTITVGDQTWKIDGRGGKDHSWGPRNWHAKIYLRWLIASFDDDHGFMLVRTVGPTKKTRSGFVWHGGKFRIVDDFEMKNTYAGEPNYEPLKFDVNIKAGDLNWKATGTPFVWHPVRHRHKDEKGEEKILRMIKSPVEWTDDKGRKGVGSTEIQDLLVDGKPYGLAD